MFHFIQTDQHLDLSVKETETHILQKKKKKNKIESNMLFNQTKRPIKKVNYCYFTKKKYCYLKIIIIILHHQTLLFLPLSPLS